MGVGKLGVACADTVTLCVALVVTVGVNVVRGAHRHVRFSPAPQHWLRTLAGHSAPAPVEDVACGDKETCEDAEYDSRGSMELLTVAVGMDVGGRLALDDRDEVTPPVVLGDADPPYLPIDKPGGSTRKSTQKGATLGSSGPDVGVASSELFADRVDDGVVRGDGETRRGERPPSGDGLGTDVASGDAVTAAAAIGASSSSSSTRAARRREARIASAAAAPALTPRKAHAAASRTSLLQLREP